MNDDLYSQPSEEQAIDLLCEWMKEWRAKEEAMIIPQFLASYAIGWDSIKYLMSKSPDLTSEFQITIAHLSDRWLKYGLSKKLLPRHMEKTFARYLTLYDDHLWEKETEQKKSVATSEVDTVMSYVVEDYGKYALEGLYDELYRQNMAKRQLDK